MRRFFAVLAATTALVGLGAFPAAAGGPNNFVNSNSTVADAGAATIVTRSSMIAGPTGTDEVTSANVARAVAHDCSGCQAIAVAFQAVLTTGNPQTVAPRNIAYAKNLRCNGCAAFAFAFQYVVSTSGPDDLSPAAVQGIEALRREVAAGLAPGLTPADRGARPTDVGRRFRELVDREIMRAGGTPSDGEMHEQMD